MSEECAKMLDAAIAEGYRAPANKADQCEHGKYGWEDCIACYDDELAKVAERMRALPAPPAPTREAIARIIDPAAFGEREILRSLGSFDERPQRKAEALARADAILDLSQKPPVATPADMAAFGASDAACVLYPGENQQPERAAFCAGAAHVLSPKQEADHGG